jgi:hypothetical protein
MGRSLTAVADRRRLISSRRGDSRHPLQRSQALGGAHLSSLAEHASRAPQLVPASDHSAWTVPLVSFDPASSDQRDAARESAHQTRARPQGSRGGRRRPTPTGTPNDRGTTRGFLLRRARPSVPRALGASWSPPRATSRTRLRHRRGDQPCGRSLTAKPHGVRLGGTMCVHMVRIVRAQMAVPFSRRSGQPRVDSTTTGHRCWSTRRYHAWTKRITVRTAGPKANANVQCRSSRVSPIACR